MKFCACSGCGRMIEKAFIYCPWCGLQLSGCSSRKYIENQLSQFENTRYNERESQIEDVGKKIQELEQELNVLVLSAEMAR